MSVQQASFFCPVCQQQRLFTAQNQVNQVLYLLLTLFSCGLWAIVWLIENLSYTPRFHCSQCGHSDSYRYLANPNLRSQEAARKAARAAMRSSSPSSNSFVEWFSGLANQFKIVIIGLALFGVVFIIGTGVAVKNEIQQSKTQSNTNSTSNSLSNNTNASVKPPVYPAGLSSAENLEMGKKALNDGDQRMAWNHLFEIKKGAKEFASAKQLLSSIAERDQIEFELGQLDEREKNLQSVASGLAYKVEPDKLKKMLDNNERVQREIYARRQELNQKMKTLP